MRINKRALFFILGAVSISASAQNKLSGRIIDENKKGIEAAVVMLVSARNKTLVSTEITNKQGLFYITQTKGSYILHISYLGYKDYSCDIEIEEDKEIQDIELEPDAVSLKEAQVTGKKYRPLSKSVNGKIHINISQSYLGDLGNALDVLKRSPGISVNNKGSISLSSLGGTAIYINGKKVRFQGEELTSYLRSLSSSAIERIEASPTPDSRYEADGAGGIINIVLKSTEESGLFISTSHGAGYWKNLKTDSNLSLSYNKSKWQLGMNYNHNIGHHGMSYGYEKIQNGNKSVSKTADTDKRNAFSGGLDFVWQPNSFHKLSLNNAVNLLAGPGETATTTIIYKGLEEPEKILRARNDYLKQKNLRYSSNITYFYSPSDQHSLSITADWTRFKGLARNHQPNSYFSTENKLLKTDIYYSQPSKAINIYAFLADYRYLPNKKSEFLLGVKTSIINSGNKFYFESNGLMDSNRSNDFNYNEKNIEGYLQYTYNWEKWSASAGTRFEYMYINGVLKAFKGGDSEENKNKRFKVFPNLTLAYSINEKNKFSASYSIRQDKPRYEDLNPFEYLLDELSYWKGNPFLRPQISNRMALIYTYSRLILSLSYNKLDDYFSSITDVFGENKTVMTTKNIGKQRQLGIDAIYSGRIFSWWDISFNTGLYYFVNKLNYEKYQQTYKKPSFIFSLDHSILLPYSINFDLSGRYYSTRQGGNYEVAKSTGSIDISLSKTWIDGSLRLSLIMTDILHSERWDTYGTKDNLNLSTWGYGESRKVIFRVSYNIGKQKFSKTGKEIEEIKRL